MKCTSMGIKKKNCTIIFLAKMSELYWKKYTRELQLEQSLSK